jgi:hypothetical protein
MAISRLTFLGILMALFISCSLEKKSNFLDDGKDTILYKNLTLNYSLNIPKEAAKNLPSGTEEKAGFLNYDYKHLPYPNNGYYISISKVNSCEPKIVGISNVKNLENLGIWGKVDIYDNLGIGDLHTVQQSPECIPPTRDKGGAYVLCAEKNERRVAICVEEQTDNPKLAEDIFKTFRWRE